MNPLLPLLTVFVAGLGCGGALPIPFWNAVFTLSLMLPVAAFSYWTRRLQWLAIPALAFVAGWSRATDDDTRFETPLSAPCVRVVEGTVSVPPRRIDSDQRMTVDVARWSPCLDRAAYDGFIPATGELTVWAPGDMTPMPFRGDTVRLRARIKPVIPRRNAGYRGSRLYDHQYRAVLSPQDVIATVSSPCIHGRRPFDAWNHRVAEVLDQRLPAHTAGLARALALGHTDALDQDMRSHFRRTGTAHLVSVSGLHLGLVALMLLVVFRALLLFTPLARRGDVGGVAALMVVPAIIAFALLTGGRPPVVRACIMAVGGLIARAIGRRTSAPEAVALAAVGILVVDPTVLFEPGFQLSFTAVIGFLIVLRPVSPRDNLLSADGPIPPVWYRLGSDLVRSGLRLFAASGVAWAVTTPLVLYHFGYVSWIAPLANLIAVPLTGVVIMPLLLALMLFGPLAPPLAEALSVPTDLALNALSGILGQLAEVSGTTENPGIVSSLGIAVVCLGVILLVIRRWPPAAAAFLTAGILFAASLFVDPPKIPPGRLTIELLDVGQGDSILVTAPSGDHLLVDAGGSPSGRYDVGRGIVVPALRSLGVSSLRAAVISHWDIDHAGGMNAVLASFDVGEIWQNGAVRGEHQNGVFAPIAARAKARGIPFLSGDALCRAHRFGGATVEVLHPCGTIDSEDAPSSNNRSLVLLITFGRIRALLTGDIDAATEAHLVAHRSLSDVAVLKLAHHGSATSTSETLLDALSPSVAVVSLGPYNRYGMPHRKIIRRLADRGILLRRTDLSGAVRVSTDGVGIEIYSRFSRANRAGYNSN